MKQKSEFHSCLQKAGYDYFSDATYYADKLEWSIRRPVNVYVCKFCGKYHIGKAKKQRERQHREGDAS